MSRAIGLIRAGCTGRMIPKGLGLRFPSQLDPRFACAAPGPPPGCLHGPAPLQSWVCGVALRAVEPEAVELVKSHGYETASSKIVMRWTVIAADLLGKGG
jgi:hypothetical protein